MDHKPSGSPRGEAVALLSLAGAILCFGSVPPFIKHFTSYLDAWTVNGIRYSTAAILWAPMVVILLRRDPAARSIWRAALVPAAVNLIGQVLWALTPYYNDAAVVGFGIRMSFLFTVVFGLMLLPGERVLARIPAFWIGSAVCIAGVVLMYGASLKSPGSTSAAGIALIIVTSLFWGLYGVCVKKYLAGYSVRLSFGVICLYTASGLLVLMFLWGRPAETAALRPATWGLLLVSAVIGVGCSHVLLYRAIATLGAVVAGGGLLVTPFVTWLGAALFVSEAMSASQVVGGVILVVGTLTLVFVHARLAAGESLARSADSQL